MARYINADELYKATQKRIAEANEARMAVVDDEFLDLIDDAFTEDVAPRAEWISVEERLPEPNEECLVSARVGDRVVIDLGEIVRYYDGRTNKYGYTWMITNDWDEGEGCEITHWMPLPEPPQMKGGAG